jgi:hypothetical protein
MLGIEKKLFIQKEKGGQVKQLRVLLSLYV